MDATEYQQLYSLLKKAAAEHSEAEAHIEWYVLCAAQRIAHERKLNALYPAAASVA